ncbi:MAG TPA: adenylate/guanylate cyclase domain-containing protein [Chthoniobacterales bacterium]|jgi:class 3 adenylate cyclase
MKRSLGASFWIGAGASASVIALQKSRVLLPPERTIGRWIYADFLPNDGVGLANYLLVIALGLAVAWAMSELPELWRRGGILFVLIAELIGASAVLSLVEIYFQPLPAILVVLLATILVFVAEATAAGQRRRTNRLLFSGKLGTHEIAGLTRSDMPELQRPIARDATFLYGEITNQAELIDEMSPPDYARLLHEITRIASEIFQREGGYVHAADGEGIRVFFGFPNSLGKHAAAAARAALALRKRILTAPENDSLGKIDLRLGISSGPIVIAMQKRARQRELVISGEPIENARRIAAANEIYGSQILLGPRAFTEAGSEIVARPIDFLRNGEAHERLEVYDLLALAADATAEEISCRDRFWMALVYFRERRWTEAFTEFNRARRANSENDRPLQWYLRRLEPILLQMATEPTPAADPFSPV